MREVPVTAHGKVDPAALRRLAYELRDRRTLADVLAWVRTQQPPRQVTDIITQDEYTHDVVLRWRDGYAVVYDST